MVIKTFRNGDNSVQTQVWATAAAIVVTSWTEASDKLQVADRFPYEGPRLGAAYQAARASAIGYAKGLVQP